MAFKKNYAIAITLNFQGMTDDGKPLPVTAHMRALPDAEIDALMAGMGVDSQPDNVEKQKAFLRAVVESVDAPLISEAGIDPLQWVVESDDIGVRAAFRLRYLRDRMNGEILQKN